MSHASMINALTNELVQLITGYSSANNIRAYQACRDAAVKSLKRHPYGRTNQFTVRNSCSGLVEKFEVLNKDDLARELDDRLRQLSSKADRWTPEVLSLLLNLSDNPGGSSRLDELKSRDAPEPVPSWSWEDRWDDDPFPDKQLWEDIDYARESSDDETTLHTRTFSEETKSTLLSDVVKYSQQPSAESLILADNPTTLELVRSYQRLSLLGHEDSHGKLTELQLVREIVSALRGLPSTLFQADSSSNRFEYRKGHQLTSVSLSVLNATGESFANILTQTQRLRTFCGRPRTTPVLQKFSHSVALHINSYDNNLSRLEERLSAIQNSVAISLLDLHRDIEVVARPILQLEQVVKEAEHFHEQKPSRILETLYERVCEAQFIGDRESYETFGTVLLDVLETYLKPISRWMRNGEIDDHRTQSDFVIGLQNENRALQTFWSSRFFIREDGGKPAGPKFLHIFNGKILAAGKNIAFMKQLGLSPESSLQQPLDTGILPLDIKYADISPIISLIPFSTYFTHVLTSYFDRLHRPTSSRLVSYLLSVHDLCRTTIALQTLYLSRNGAHFTNFATELFLKLDAADPTWNNSLVLHDLIAGTFGQSPVVDADDIIVFSSQALGDFDGDATRQYNRDIKALASIKFEYNYLWPIANIIPSSTLTTYQATFTFLLQLQRASLLLSSLRLRTLRDTRPVNATHSPPSASLRQSYRLSHQLRHRFVFIVATLQDNLLNMQISPLSRDLAAAIDTALDVDSLIVAHQKFLMGLARGALLVKEVENAKSSVIALLNLCVLFVDLAKGVGREVGTFTPDAKQTTDTLLDNDFNRSGLDGEVEIGKPHNHPPAASTGAAEARQACRPVKVPSQPSPDVIRRLERIRTQLHQLLLLITSSLRSASRHREGEIEESWVLLAERLDMAAPSFAQ